MQGVEVGDSLQHLAHHIAGVSLWVVTLIQDPVKYLSACCTVEKDSALSTIQVKATRKQRSGDL